MNDIYISCEEAAKLIGLKPQSIRIQAQTDAKKLGFSVCVVGTRVMIPRKPFMEFWGISENLVNK